MILTSAILSPFATSIYLISHRNMATRTATSATSSISIRLPICLGVLTLTCACKRTQLSQFLPSRVLLAASFFHETRCVKTTPSSHSTSASPAQSISASVSASCPRSKCSTPLTTRTTSIRCRRRNSSTSTASYVLASATRAWLSYPPASSFRPAKASSPVGAQHRCAPSRQHCSDFASPIILRSDSANLTSPKCLHYQTAKFKASSSTGTAHSSTLTAPIPPPTSRCSAKWASPGP